MAGLKTLVIAMGIAIIIGATVVVMTIIQRAGTLSAPSAAKAIQLADGARVVESNLDGDRILLRVRGADGTERLLIVRAADGQVVMEFTLGPGGAAR
ncbi:MAG TPA: hypothetical protein VLN73_09380 [Alphaproteobacteria bacterium]|nr:hypothetical protein [Alphaproteobacteria bacterium]